MIDSNLLEVVGPALAIGIPIALCHAVLGTEVVRRGIIFIDLAVAQIGALGLLVVMLTVSEPPWWLHHLSALISAFAAVVFFHWIERRRQHLQEAIIGTSFVVAGATALLLLTDHPHGAEEFRHLLSGQILFTSWPQVAFHGPIISAAFLLWLMAPRLRKGTWFYVIFAVVITSSVQIVGVYVVFATLVLPAIAIDGQRRFALFFASAVSVIAMIAGMGGSIVTDLPTGPAIVISFAATAVLFAAIRFLRNRLGRQGPA